MQKKITYFAYGSNMNPDQMKTRCPGAEAICPAKLKNYCLAERLYADIDPEEGSNVYGVLYSVPEDEMKEMDRHEGAPHTYRRIKVEVEFAMRPRKAVTYILTPEKKKERDGIPFPDDYRERCSAGAEHYHIPNDFEFVTLITYGTLMTGEHNHRLVRSALSIKPCLIKGTLYDTGWGFPAYTQDGESSILAEIIRIPRKDWTRVDHLEGYPDLYTREFIVAQCGDITAGGWVYIMNELPPHAKVIKEVDRDQRIVSWKSKEKLVYDKLVYWHSDDTEDIKLTIDLRMNKISGRIGELDVPRHTNLDEHSKSVFLDLLKAAHFELWQTEYYSNGDETSEWQVDLLNGRTKVKTIHGINIKPLFMHRDCLYVIQDVARRLIDEL